MARRAILLREYGHLATGTQLLDGANHIGGRSPADGRKLLLLDDHFVVLRQRLQRRLARRMCTTL